MSLIYFILFGIPWRWLGYPSLWIFGIWWIVHQAQQDTQGESTTELVVALAVVSAIAYGIGLHHGERDLLKTQAIEAKVRADLKREFEEDLIKKRKQ